MLGDQAQSWPQFQQADSQYKLSTIYEVAPSFLGDLAAYFTMNPFPIPIAQVTGYKDTARVVVDSEEITASQPTMQFDSVPDNYFGLAIRYIARCDAAAVNVRLQLQFNGDGGANYHGSTVDRNLNSAVVPPGGPGPVGWNSVQQNHNINSIPVGEVPGTGATQAYTAGAGVIEIPGYTNTTFSKIVTSKGTCELDLTLDNQLFDVLGAGHWNNTAAVTSITLQPATGNFVAGSRAVLYGF